MYQQFTFLCPDGAEFTGPSDVHIRKAFILTLPFRLRVGARFTVPVDDSFDVVLLLGQQQL